MKKSHKISSSFTAFLAVLILFVSSLSSSISNNVHRQDIHSKSEKKSTKSQSSDKYYFSKSSIEAVFSQIISSFDCEAVIFLVADFKYLIEEVSTKYINYFDRNSHLEILFEHLNAPNAP